MSAIPTLLLILDGLADEPLPELGERTPLQAAHLPTLERLAQQGKLGLTDPIGPGVIPNTAEGTLAIFGYDPQHYHVGRGIVEAFGVGLEVRPGDIALRGNWATLNEAGQVLDRRAGRIREGTEALAEALQELSPIGGIEILIKAGTEHRLALILRGTGLSAEITGSDPHISPPQTQRLIPQAMPTGSAEARHTAQVLDQFERRAQAVLQKHPLNQERLARGLMPANAILTRDVGEFVALPPLQLPGRGLCIAGEKTILGLARLVALETFSHSAMTGNLDTDLKLKFTKAREALNHYAFVVLHIKGCDIAAHDQQGERKREFLEQIDTHLEALLAQWGQPLRLGVATDHGTSSLTGNHLPDPVPVLGAMTSAPLGAFRRYDEAHANQGDWGAFRMCDFLKKLWAM